MMKFRFSVQKLSLFIAIFCASWSVSAVETKFATTLSAETGTPLPYAENTGDFLLGNIKADEAATVYLTDDITFFSNATAVYDPLAYDDDVYDFASDDRKVGIILKEAWLDYSSELWATRIGRQIVSWGKSDVVSVTNVLCPNSYTTLNIQDGSDTTLGIDAFRLSGHYDAYSVDFYWIPFVRSSVLPTNNEHPIQKLVTEKFTIDLMKSKEPELKFKNSEFGVKASGYWKWGDASLYGFYGWTRIPEEFEISLKQDSEEKLYSSLQGKANRLVMFGGDAAIPVGDVVVRMEGAFFYNQVVSALKLDSILKLGSILADSRYTYVNRNKISGVIGVDWMPSGWVLSAQYYGDAVLGDVSQVFRKRYIHLATAIVSRSFFKDMLSLSMLGALQFEEWNHAIGLIATFSATDQLSFYGKVFAINLLSDIPETIKEYKHWGGITAGVRLKL